MDCLVSAGTLCLGLLIGILVAYFVFEVKTMDHTALYSAVGVIGGAGVIAIFHLLGGWHSESRREYWFYPIGLLAGYIIGTIYERIEPPEVYEAKLKKRLKKDAIVEDERHARGAT
jgi:uncharacterized membrane-anchored protein YhcB (DUF1043 family)